MFLFPLIVFSLVFLVSTSQALPTVENTEFKHVLTPTNFSDSIKDGVWLINFKSPVGSRHLREFAPTWERLVAYIDAQRDPGISLAQVDCLPYWLSSNPLIAPRIDICKQENIYGYPSLFIYEDGLKTDEFDGQREYGRLTTFIEAHARKTTPFMSPLDPNPINSDPTPERNMQSVDFESSFDIVTALRSVPSASVFIASDFKSDRGGEVFIYDSEGLAEPMDVARERSPALPETQQVFSV